MDDLETAQESIRWLRFAKEDLTSAVQLVNATPPSYRSACWHYQQAAEKALKAALLLESIEFPFVHDLDILCDLLPEDWTVRDAYSDLSDLTEWAIEARYPGEWPEPTYADAIRAESTARSVYDLIVTGFKQHGILL